MRNNRFPSFVIAGIAFVSLASSALAENTFMLQLGQFDSREAARTQWSLLQKNHGDLLGDHTLNIAEVQLDADKKTVYRVQASPFSSRAEAQTLCADLTMDKVDCLVVETSMASAPKAPAKAVENPKQPAATAKKEEAKKTVSNKLPVLDLPTNTKPAVSEEMMADEAAPSLEAAPELAATDAQKNVPPAEPAKKTSSFREALMPWLKPSTPDAEAKPVEQPAIEQPVKEVAKPVKEEAKAEPMAAAPVPAPEEPKKVVFKRIEHPESKAPKPIIILAPGEPMPDLEASASEDISNYAPQETVQQQASPAESELAARAPRALTAPASAAPLEDIAPQVAVIPTPEGANSDVEVAEAIRVPLSLQDNPPVLMHKPVGYGGLPSQPTYKTTVWVQLGNFSSKEDAMGFWRDVNYQHPDLLSMLRVRVVSPWQPRHSTPRTTLRLGPITNPDDMKAICKIAEAKQLLCTSVNDIGSSAPANAPRARRTESWDQYEHRASAYRPAYQPGQPGGMFWVQLGAFSDVGEAQSRWSEMLSVHGDLLGRMQPQISYPALSSSAQSVFHLRTGPFVNRPAAENLCDSLKSRRMGCIVVQSR